MNYRTERNSTAPLVLLTALAALTISTGLWAQGAPAAAPTPQAVSPIDLTGYWVSVVTEDWRYRMIVADKNDYASVPLTLEGRNVVGMWDPAKDTAAGEQCKAFGAGGIMRIPGRLHITWDNPTTLKVETDSGKQTRLFHFDGEAPVGAVPSWQGYSAASWDGLAPRGPGGAAPAAKEGYLRAMTTNVRAGYLRTNGVPYSANAQIEEYFDGFKEPNGDVWLVVTTVVTDPIYLVRPFIVSTHFKKIPDAAGWSPTECHANEPR